MPTRCTVDMSLTLLSSGRVVNQPLMFRDDVLSVSGAHSFQGSQNR
ncbi:hypothetical protein ABIB18_001528 [Pantoea sp. UYEF8]